MANPVHSRKLPPAKYLRECFDYDPAKGSLRWKERPKKHFKSDRGWKAFNSQWPGKEAFTAVSSSGGRTGFVNSVQLNASHVVYRMVTGKNPYVVKARDGDRSNIRWENIEHVTRLETVRSGVPGVTKAGSMWRVRIGSTKTANGIQRGIHVGHFATKKEAVAARRAAEIEHGYREAVK